MANRNVTRKSASEAMGESVGGSVKGQLNAQALRYQFATQNDKGWIQSAVARDSARGSNERAEAMAEYRKYKQEEESLQNSLKINPPPQRHISHNPSTKQFWQSVEATLLDMKQVWTQPQKPEAVNIHFVSIPKPL